MSGICATPIWTAGAVRYCWRNPPYPSFEKGGDPKAPFAKGAARSAGGFAGAAVEQKTFASRIAWLAHSKRSLPLSRFCAAMRQMYSGQD